MSFEEYWKARGSLICLETRKAVADDAWNSAIEHIRTTEPMPVSEHILATLLRIESRMPEMDSLGGVMEDFKKFIRNRP